MGHYLEAFVWTYSLVVTLLLSGPGKSTAPFNAILKVQLTINKVSLLPSHTHGVAVI